MQLFKGCMLLLSDEKAVYCMEMVENIAKIGKKKDNYLDYVFEKNPVIEWHEREDGIICICVAWKGFYNKIAQKVFKKPKKSEIAMDVLGSFVWKQLDGKKNIFEVGKLVKEEFGDRAEPVYGRLIKFVEIMRDNKYVVLKEEKKHD